MTRKHVVISGTGRAGTTFLVELLTRLGLETGFTLENLRIHALARAGLEHDVRKAGSPYIVKSPWFCDYAEEVLQRDDIHIEHVFVPMRDLHASAESRRHVQRLARAKLAAPKRLLALLRPPGVPGGLWHTSLGRNQENVLLEQLYKLTLALSGTTIPVTLLRFPRFIRDGSYLYAKLGPILDGVEADRFLAAHRETARPELVHSFSPGDS